MEEYSLALMQTFRCHRIDPNITLFCKMSLVLMAQILHVSPASKQCLQCHSIMGFDLIIENFGMMSTGQSRAGPGPRVVYRREPPAPENLVDLILFQGSRPPMHCNNAAFRWKRPRTRLSRHNFRCKISLSRV